MLGLYILIRSGGGRNNVRLIHRDWAVNQQVGRSKEAPKFCHKTYEN
jgi:hypothetical protein